MASERAPEDRIAPVDRGDVLRVHATWRRGPRTRAWDELWRWLLEPPTTGEGDEEEGQADACADE